MSLFSLYGKKNRARPRESVMLRVSRGVAPSFLISHVFGSCFFFLKKEKSLPYGLHCVCNAMLSMLSVSEFCLNFQFFV